MPVILLDDVIPHLAIDQIVAKMLLPEFHGLLDILVGDHSSHQVLLQYVLQTEEDLFGIVAASTLQIGEYQRGLGRVLFVVRDFVRVCLEQNVVLHG